MSTPALARPQARLRQRFRRPHHAPGSPAHQPVAMFASVQPSPTIACAVPPRVHTAGRWRRSSGIHRRRGSVKLCNSSSLPPPEALAIVSTNRLRDQCISSERIFSRRAPPFPTAWGGRLSNCNRQPPTAAARPALLSADRAFPRRRIYNARKSRCQSGGYQTILSRPSRERLPLSHTPLSRQKQRTRVNSYCRPPKRFKLAGATRNEGRTLSATPLTQISAPGKLMLLGEHAVVPPPLPGDPWMRGYLKLELTGRATTRLPSMRRMSA